MAESNSASGTEQAKVANSNLSSFETEKIINMATNEIEYRTELFNRVTNACFNKCVEKRYKDVELHIGESSCIDRCVLKYWQVNNIIGQLLGSGRPTM